MTPSAAKESIQARRSEVEDLVCGLPGGRDGDRAFDEPWQIRAFALAVGAHKAGGFEWSGFQSALIESIGQWEDRADSVDQPSWSYYEHWLKALEAILDQTGVVPPEVLDDKTREVLATPANRGHHHAQLDPIAIDRAIRN
jgi:nitrile hydratase accessory protein